jgi:hypothetical protein
MTFGKGLPPQAMAGVDLIRRVGALQFQIRYSDDEQPAIWVAVAGFNLNHGRPVPAKQKGKLHWESASALDPTIAILRLCESLIDGGTCQHCQRPTGFTPDLDRMPLDELVCWYQFDPELATFRRGCEGD